MKFSKYFLTVLIVSLVAGIYFWYFVINPSKNSPELSPVATETPNVYVDFSLDEPPSQSLKGLITNLDGDVRILGRTATEEASLNSPTVSVQQGENYITGDDGELSIIFKNAVELDMDQNSEVDVIQTIPAGIVFSQINGEVSYKKIGDYPVTVRTSYLLTEIDGDVAITRDTDNFLVAIKINSGSVTFAYNDKDYISRVIEAEEGQVFSFNYDTRQGVLK